MAESSGTRRIRMRNKRCMVHKIFLAALLFMLAVLGFAKMYEQPRSFALNDRSQDQVEVKALPQFDTDSLVAEDRARARDRQHLRPRRFATAANVAYALDN